MEISVKLTKLYYHITHIFFKSVTVLYKKRKYVIAIFFLTAYILGVIGITESIELCESTDRKCTDKSWFSWIGLLALENFFVQLPNELSNFKVVTAQFIAYIALLLTIILALFKDGIVSLKLITLAKVKHTLVIGLGENNRTYLESELNASNDGSFIIIEPDAANIHAKLFIEKGIGVFFGTLDEYKVQFKHLSRVVISTGDDRVNIEIAEKLIGLIPVEMTKKSFGCNTVIHIHLQNQDYKALFQQGILNRRKDLPLEFKPYSFNDETARALFEKHTVLGNFHVLAQTSTHYSIAIVGDGDLAERIVYHLCMLANLPNKNHLTVHCVNENPSAFISRLHSAFAGLSKISAVSFREHTLSLQEEDFYLSGLWKKDNLTNVIICHDDENINLDCVVNLHDKVYLQEAVEKTMKTKVHFAMYHNLELSRTINENTEEFKEFFTFGDAKEICSKEHFIDEKYEKIAKLIHFGYAEVYQKNMLLHVDDNRKGEEISQKWQKSINFTKRESNRSQALHINTKLMSLGLKKVEVDMNRYRDDELLELNLRVMKNSRDKFIISDTELVAMSEKLYSKNKEDQNIVEDFFENVIKMGDVYSRLANAEHERWSAFHYLNGWSYDEHRNDKIKHHNCLLPFEDYTGFDRRQTIIYDLYATLYIPNYLASTGYRIVPIEDISIGITGHRNINMDDKTLREYLKKELQNLISSHGNVELVSPLAEGADRLFVDVALKLDLDESCMTRKKMKQLTVPMPFRVEDYEKDFIKLQSKIEFKKYLCGGRDRAYSLIKTKRSQRKKISFFNWKTILKMCIDSKLKERKDKYDKHIQSKFDNQQYKKVGQEVVDRSDILFALWDGEPANGEGGTANIVNYAISKRKTIIWINPNTYELVITEYPYHCDINSKNGIV